MCFIIHSRSGIDLVFQDPSDRAASPLASFLLVPEYILPLISFLNIVCRCIHLLFVQFFSDQVFALSIYEVAEDPADDRSPFRFDQKSVMVIWILPISVVIVPVLITWFMTALLDPVFKRYSGEGGER